MNFLRRSLLLVEDQVLIARMEKASLENYGYRVTVVYTGEEALALMGNDHSIDLILMDIDLGSGINGVEAATEILKKVDIPVVFLSAHTEPDVVELTERITSYGYVVKPTNITVLDASIKMAFKLFEAKQKERLKELALRESEEKFRLLFQNLNTNFALHEVVTDQEGKPVDFRYLMVNPAFEQVVGMPSASIIGRTARELFPGTEQYWIDKFAEVAFTGVPIHYENCSKELDRTFEMNIYSPQRGQFALIGLDVTERRIATARLEESRNILEGVMANSRDVVFSLNAQGEFRRLSPSFEAVLGVPAAEILGRSFVSLVRPEDVQPLTVYLQTVLAEGGPKASPRFMACHANGRWIAFEASGSAFRNSLGELEYLGVAGKVLE